MQENPLFAAHLLLAILKIFYYRRSVSEFTDLENKSLGLVPTMGALHAGHLQLVLEARKLCDLVLVTIFVNPLQFNNEEDLKKYPKSLNEDLKMLQNAGVDAVFVPTNEEIYYGIDPVNLDISPLDAVFEGQHRHGHFNGVISILSQLFALIRPTDAFFGLKDLQQCLVVEKLIKAKFSHISQHNCTTLREQSGLALSSRNMRLTDGGKRKAALIYKELNKIKENTEPPEFVMAEAGQVQW